jgi:hypothetical protein
MTHPNALEMKRDQILCTEKKEDKKIGPAKEHK